jgi:tetratricopeptide (TPR) repeat protein
MCGYKLTYKIFTALILVLIYMAPLAGQKHKKYTRQGNRDYGEKNFEDSEMLYRRAVDSDPSFNKAIFNLGDALYKQEKYEEALDNFRQLSEKEVKRDMLAGSYYNMGNSLLKSGKIEESIEAYKNALRNDPSNMEAKYNLAYAQDLLEQQEDQQQQQQQDQQQENDRQQDQDQQQDDKSEDENEDQQQKDDQEQAQDKQQQQDQDQQQQQQQQQMSREDAERLLQALAENEKEVQEKVKKEKAARARVRTLKNW